MWAIISAVWLVGGFITSLVFHVLIPDASKFIKWIVAAAALWPFTLPVLLTYGAFVAGPRAAVKRFKHDSKTSS